jgi:hypothetical protein
MFDPALLGSWFDPTDKDAGTALVFENGETNSYQVTFVDFSGDQHLDLIFDARLIKLGGHLFIDAVQKKAKVRGQEVDMGAVVPGHLVGRVSLQGDVLRMSFLDDDWVQKGIEAGTISVRHEDIDGTPVLTASTQELQKFLLDHSEDDKAFSVHFDELHRRK